MINGTQHAITKHMINLNSLLTSHMYALHYDGILFSLGVSLLETKYTKCSNSTGNLVITIHSHGLD